MSIDDMTAGEEATEAAPAPAGLLAQLRPYVPTRYLAEALCSGSLVLSRRGWEWVTGSGGRVARGRSAGLALGVYVAGYEELHGQSWILPVLCGAWVVGALVHSPAALAAAGSAGTDEDGELEEFDDEQLLDGDEDQAGEIPAPPPLPPLDVHTVARLVREIADEGGWQGAHLDDLLTRLPGRSKNELCATLTQAGIAVTEQLKLRLPGGVQRNRQGVRLDSLPAGLGEGSSAPAAGLRVVPPPAAAEGAAEGSPPPTPAPSLQAG
jgi:hypothetical protein